MVLAAGVREGISSTLVRTETRGSIATSQDAEAKLSAWVAFVIAVVLWLSWSVTGCN